MKKYIWPFALLAATAAVILLAWRFHKRKRFEVVIPENRQPLTTKSGDEVAVKLRRPGAKIWSQ